jgi:formylglycine-generating enzyme required for sulfatase activity
MLNETPCSDDDPETRLPFEPEMVSIPVSEFLMGADAAERPSFGDADAASPDVENTYAAGWGKPQHTLYLPDYALARTPVTHAQYAAFLQDTQHHRPKRWRSLKPPRGKEQFPVVFVTWNDANAYCRWLAAATGKRYRLPSEAEWEKGAGWEEGAMAVASRPMAGEGAPRGRKRRYPWGDEWEPGRCNSAEAELNGITSVDAHPQGASPYGLLDMAGNAWEWTASLWGTNWYQPDYVYAYDPADGREDLEADARVCRVLRGGSFAYTRQFAQCAYRYKNFPDGQSEGIGFRVVLTCH